MRKNLILRLALVGTIAFSLHSCRTEDEVLAIEEQVQFRAPIAMFQKFDEKVQSDTKFRNENRQQDFQRAAERNSTPYISTVNIPISAVSYKVPFKETIAAFLTDAENTAFSQEFYSKFGSPFYAVSTYTYGNNSKAIAFPILKGDQVTAFIHGIVTPARDYVQFTVVQNSEPATLQVLARLQYAVDNLYPAGPVMSRGIGTNEEHIRVNEIEEITIVKISHMDQTGGFILHHPGYDWWKDASWADPKNGPMGGGQSMSGDGSKHKFPDYMSPDDDPCKKMKAQVIDSAYQAKIAHLKTKTGEKKETGYAQYKTGSYVEILPSASTENSDGMDLSPSISMIGYMHTHLNDYEITEDGATVPKKPIRMFSPSDVIAFMQIAQYNADEGRPLENIYATMISSEGDYMLKFSGTKYNIKTNFSDDETYREMYKDYFENNKDRTNEVNFLNFIKDKMGVYGVSLYKVNADDGTISKKEISKTDSNTIESTDCPE